MDIQAKNVAKTKEHLLMTVSNAYKFFFGVDFSFLTDAENIICKRVVCGNSLEFMHYIVPPTQRDADWFNDHKNLIKHKLIHDENSADWQQQLKILLNCGFICDDNLTGQTTLF